MKSRAPVAARGRLRITAVASTRDPLFRSAFALYTRVFPASERIDRKYFAQLFDEKALGILAPFNYHFLVARRGDRLVGFVTGAYLAVANVGFVGYLAVAPETKGGRTGSRLRDRLVREFRRDARANRKHDLRGVMGEVEPQNPWLRHLIRKGALALDVDYRQPAIDGASAVPLVLYLEPVSGRLRSLSANVVRQLLYAIYRRLYRVRFPLRNPEFRLMLRDLAGRTRVGSRKLPRLPRARRPRGGGLE